MSDTTKDADRTISATEARSGLSDLIFRAKFSEERTVLTRHGEPAAALVSIEGLRKLEDATDVKRARESIEKAREHGGTKPVGEFRKELEAKGSIKAGGAVSKVVSELTVSKPGGEDEF